MPAVYVRTASGWQALFTPSPSLVSTLPVTPPDGTEVYFQTTAMATLGIAWHLRYRSGSASAYKWEYLGGGSLNGMVDGGGVIACSSTPYTETNFASPTIVLPLAGDYDLEAMVGGFFGGAVADFRIDPKPDTGSCGTYPYGFQSTDANGRGFEARPKVRWFGCSGSARIAYASAAASYQFTVYTRHLWVTPVRVG